MKDVADDDVGYADVLPCVTDKKQRSNTAGQQLKSNKNESGSY